MRSPARPRCRGGFERGRSRHCSGKRPVPPVPRSARDGSTLRWRRRPTLRCWWHRRFAAGPEGSNCHDPPVTSGSARTDTRKIHGWLVRSAGRSQRYCSPGPPVGYHMPPEQALVDLFRPVKRAADTATRHSGDDVTRLPHREDLREINFGRMGAPAVLPRSKPKTQITWPSPIGRTPGDVRPPNGESWNEVCAIGLMLPSTRLISTHAGQRSGHRGRSLRNDPDPGATRSAIWMGEEAFGHIE